MITDSIRLLRFAVLVFGLIFAIAGLGLLIELGIPILDSAVETAQWAETPCVVLDSEVRREEDGRGRARTPVVRYRYESGGRAFESDVIHRRRLPVVNGGSGARDLVDRYPPDSSCVCYVDPADPTRSVLLRGLSPEDLVLALPVVFIAVGLWICLRAAWVLVRTSR